WRLPVAPLLWLGHLFNITLYIRLGLVPLLLTVVALFGLWFNRIEAGVTVLQLLSLPVLAITIGISVVVVNLISQLSRAAAIRRYAGEKPAFGLGLAYGLLPCLITSTEGPAERADRRGRLRIIAAPLHATLWLF